MANSKSTKRALLTSALAILMCVAMLIGTTFAWFTDTASTAVNRIQAGNLDIEVEYAKEVLDENGKLTGEITPFKTIQDSTEVFDADAKWEPGRREYVIFKISNKGSLALKYKFNLNVLAQKAGINQNGDTYFLADYLCASAKACEDKNVDYGSGYSGSEFLAVWNDLAAAGTTPALAEKPLSSAAFEGTLLAGERQAAAMVVWMPTTVGNEANAISPDKAATVDFGINVVATQYTHEKDSFDDQYDKDAPYETVKVSDEKELRTALYEAPTDGRGVKIVLQDDITLETLYSQTLFTHSNEAGTWTGHGYTEAEAQAKAADPVNGAYNDNEVGVDTLSRYKIGVHPTDEDPSHWNALVTDQSLEERAAFGAYTHANADDERIARLVVKTGQDVILDLNGHNLSKAGRATHGDWSVTCTNLIGNYGTLSIVDSEGTGLITGSGLTSCSGGVIQNFGGKLTIGEINIDGGAQGGAGQYTIVNGAQELPGECRFGAIVLDGAHIFDDATSASLICNMEGNLVVKGGADLRHVNTKVINVKGGSVSVEDAIVKSDVYAIYIENGKVTINGMTIKGSGTIENKGGTLTDNRE